MNDFKPSEKDIATGDPQMLPDDITAQEALHEAGEACDEEDCQECCGKFCGHEFEDYHCLNCGAETDGSHEANRAHEISEGER